jgi:hypothetical protein
MLLILFHIENELRFPQKYPKKLQNRNHADTCPLEMELIEYGVSNCCV